MMQTTPNSSSSDRSGTDKTSAASPQNNKPGLGQFLWCIPLVAVLIIIDQITKRIAVNVLADGLRIPLINGVLEFTFVQNRGAAFGIMQNALPFFVVITLAALCVITYFLLHIPSQKRYLPLRICLCFIAAGAIGNFIDRLRLSYVRDFIYFSLIDFPVFNVADIYITCATILLVLLMLFYYRDEDDFSLLK
ncbi:MAG: signal peptidase II [Lachnospiraceae bacterium]|jgi:signal peptidase II|nr:signal peptidase II [Lachnospiraceae bacterium]